MEDPILFWNDIANKANKFEYIAEGGSASRIEVSDVKEIGARATATEIQPVS